MIDFEIEELADRWRQLNLQELAQDPELAALTDDEFIEVAQRLVPASSQERASVLWEQLHPDHVFQEEAKKSDEFQAQSKEEAKKADEFRAWIKESDALRTELHTTTNELLSEIRDLLARR